MNSANFGSLGQVSSKLYNRRSLMMEKGDR